MKIIQNLETWLLYGGSLDERIRMGFDKAGYLGFIVFLFGGVGLGIYHRFSGNITSDIALWFSLLVMSTFVFTVALVAQGATSLDTHKQRKALLSLGIASLPLLYVLMWLLSKKVNIWYHGASPFELLCGATIGSSVVVLFVWIVNSLASKRSENLSRTK
jgi:hypothetical protein